ncbi:heat shock 70 kDa protein 12A-like [Mytilus trossulus]|uniref:heat shock 70 kDa protein 12A-like n=1 Tax=Mytilus trossulus TaxID=6551 RepID=UPI003005A1E6
MLQNITTEMTLDDLSGKPVAAIHVFGLSIKALVDHLMDMVKIRGSSLKMNEIQWVLTVPAIWTDNAKQFMRKSAEMAGIPPERLILALEPEAASIFCQYLPTEKLQGIEQGFSMAETGTKYMVVDLGGGTADITVHEKMADGKLKELCRANGSDCGGTSVDGRFFQLLVKILSGPLMKSLRDENLSAYLDLFREFETVKRTIDSSKAGKINMTVPYVALDKMCKRILKEDFPSVVESSIFAKEISLRGDKIRIDVDRMIKLFKPTIDSIIALMKEVLKDKTASGVTLILLVGGFSECRLIKESVHQVFTNKKIIIPDEAGLCVLKGAVLFGHRPDYIQSRVMRFSYGLESSHPFNEKKHDIKYLEEINGEKKCRKIFSKLVSKDEAVQCGKKVIKEFFTLFEQQEMLNFELFISTDVNPRYVDEVSCTFIGEMKMKLPSTCMEKRYVDVEIVFGNTEIEMTAVDRKSNEKISSSFNLV